MKKPAKPERDRFLSGADFRRLLLAAKGGRGDLGERDYMLLCLAGNLGLRVSEVVALRFRDCHTETREPFLRVKTAKQRRDVLDDLPLDHGLLMPLESYLATLGQRAEARYGEYLPLADRRSLALFPGPSPWAPLSTRMAEKIFKAAAERAGIRPHVSFHALRHYRGVALYRETKDLLVVKRFLRHSSISSTFVYLHLDSIEADRVNSLVGSIT